MHSVEELFWLVALFTLGNPTSAHRCSVDDFCQVFEQQWQNQLLSHELQVHRRKRSLCLSEVMTILIGFHQSYYRNFKSYYLEKVQTQWQSHFPKLVSYNRFIEWVPDSLIPLCGYLRSCFGTCTGISFMDSTCLKVCHNRRINQHKVFKDIGVRSKTLTCEESGSPFAQRLRRRGFSGVFILLGERLRQRGFPPNKKTTRQRIKTGGLCTTSNDF